MKILIEKLSSESRQPKEKVRLILESISDILKKQGCEVEDPRFLRYLVRRARKRLKIQESKTFKTFKEFFNEK